MKLLYTLIILSVIPQGLKNEDPIAGAWMQQDKGVTTVLLFCDGYTTITRYTDTAFLESSGGPYTVNSGIIHVNEEFNTASKTANGYDMRYELKDGSLYLPGKGLNFERADANDGALKGAWKITKRMQDGQLVPIQHRGTRKTLKILTGKRFQWFAIDPATNSFSGTGGGTYSFRDGKYVENIEFFSRDVTRVGASLSFDDHVEDGEWHHTGLSSTGAKIYEVWGKVQQ